MLTLSLRWPWIHREERALSTTVIGGCALAVSLLCQSTSTSFATPLARWLSPLSLLFISESITLLFTLMTFGLVPIVGLLARLNRREWLSMLAVGLTNSVLAPLAAFAGLPKTGAANAELFLRTDAFFLLFFGWLWLGEKLHKRHVIGGILIILGMIAVAARGSGFAFRPGDILLVLAAVLYSIGVLTYRRSLLHVPQEAVLFLRSCIAIGFFFAVSPFIEHTLITDIRAFPWTLGTALLGYAIMSRWMSMYAFYNAVERLPVHLISLLQPLSSAGSMVMASLYLGERIGAYQLLGGALVIAGAIAAEARFHIPWHKHEELKEQVKTTQRQHV